MLSYGAMGRGGVGSKPNNTGLTAAAALTAVKFAPRGVGRPSMPPHQALVRFEAWRVRLIRGAALLPVTFLLSRAAIQGVNCPVRASSIVLPRTPSAMYRC